MCFFLLKEIGWNDDRITIASKLFKKYTTNELILITLKFRHISIRHSRQIKVQNSKKQKNNPFEIAN